MDFIGEGWMYHNNILSQRVGKLEFKLLDLTQSWQKHKYISTMSVIVILEQIFSK